MEIRLAFAQALRKARKANGLTQEDFAEVSSRTYLSTLERGQNSPTLDKVHVLAQTIGIHTLSLLTLSYLYSKNGLTIDSLFEQIKLEIEFINQEQPSSGQAGAAESAVGIGLQTTSSIPTHPRHLLIWKARTPDSVISEIPASSASAISLLLNVATPPTEHGISNISSTLQAPGA